MSETETEKEHLDHQEKVRSLLPHFVFAGLFLVFLVLNFFYYRRSNERKYQRKIEKKLHEMMSLTPRRITSMMRYSDCLRPPYHKDQHHQSTTNQQHHQSTTNPKPQTVMSKTVAEAFKNKKGVAGKETLQLQSNFSTHDNERDNNSPRRNSGGPYEDTEEDRDCASVHMPRSSPKTPQRDSKPRKLTLPPLMFASPSVTGGGKRREMDAM